ncbi:MAG: glutamate--tRNA ligase [Nitrospinae bacterium CG11_big_fil_rev_8_21_14_0_20_45_15]|nr:MAG: glutamate--tRNA ligase [Nitrospinae bacterium CG11_big_fil_rev_8_21_14_0_20_45_15]
MTLPVKVRFAPSPTGYLHIGGVRTALFNWLFARNMGGTFVLRIEDTDVSRSTEESIQEIISAMKWLGLDWDEGPYRQMERREVYDRAVEKLIKEGNAYRCYCSAETLDAKRKEALERKGKPKYDGTCRNLTGTSDAPHVVRFKAPAEGTVTVKDLLRGNVTFDNEELDDFIIQRTDGTPTYNFVVVVDDADMGITHVIRGDDHLSNTPRQALMYDALGYPRPQFAHISMILGSDKTRLSKRHGATSTLAYRDMGYLPDALINYLARLGWSHGDQEIFTREEMIRFFNFDSVSVSAAVFNPEKLLWLNHQYIQAASLETLASLLENLLIHEKILPENHEMTPEEIARPIPILKERSQTIKEMADKAEFYFRENITIDETAGKKFLTQSANPLLEELVNGLRDLSDITEETLEKLFKEIVEKADIKLGKLAQPVRVALTGQTASPGIYDVILLLGKERTLKRLSDAISYSTINP